MKQPLTPPAGQLKPPSLADTLNAGAGVFLRRAWVLSIPLLIDSWLRWTARFAPDWLVDRLQQQLAGLSGWFEGTDLQLAPLQSALDGLRAVDLRHSAVIIQRFPSLLGGLSPAPTELVWLPAGWSSLILLVIGLNIAAMFASTLFLLPLAAAISGQPPGVQWLRRIGPVTWQLLRYLALILGIMILVGGPILICTLWLMVLSATLGLVVGGIWLATMITIWVYASFGLEAILLNQTGVWLAAYQSYNIVNTYLWDTLLLVAASFILTYGFQQLLTPLLTTGWGTGLASIAFGSLMATLSAARMLFYRDRLAQLARKSPVFIAG